MADLTKSLKKYWVELCFVFLIPLVFYRAFMAPYVTWDDDVLILKNPLLQLPFWEALKNAFQVYYHGDYFPLTLMSYWLDFQVFGLSAPAQHIENLVLHLVATLLLFRVLKSVSQKDRLSFFITLVFALHPLQMESVMWISERKSLLAAVFMFLSIAFYLKTVEKPGKASWYWLAVLFFALMGLTKATALLLPALFLLLDWKYLAGARGKIFKRFLPLALLAGVLIVLRVQAYSSSATEAGAVFRQSERLLQVPWMALTAIGFYIKMFFFPTPYSPIYPAYAVNSTTILWMVAAAGVLVFTAIYLWRKKNLFLWFCGAWFLLFLSPVLQLFPRINFVNDRYMYLPIVGLAGIFFYWVSEKVPAHLRTVKVFAGAAVTFAASLGLQSFNRSEAFTSNRALWTQALTIVPEDMIALNNLGLDYHLAGEVDKAVELYTKVVTQPGTNSLKAITFGNLAGIYSDHKYKGYDSEKAIQLYQKGIASVQRLHETYELRINLGITYKDLGRNAEAKEVLLAVLQDLSRESDYKFQNLKIFVERHLQSLPN
ncbi:tetratricopeptide repeat protein [Bdellovibrio sp. HCB337]|uniref:tetratricopeptide repeat protein n=1 Tax=Bdellovibrio sp. HCB337 TaxID=3394358 RepID=UPI0039A49D9D